MRRKNDRLLWLLALSGIAANFGMTWGVVRVASRVQAAFSSLDADQVCKQKGFVKPKDVFENFNGGLN